MDIKEYGIFFSKIEAVTSLMKIIEMLPLVRFVSLNFVLTGGA